ncbi:unnamed protein product [Bursaphelenchus okinawaensis]|uniref:Cadherin domain-containing protein n=1 Tax=Bursaphelenchus okinawaensis TaxID=465554 RepID=A0A811KXL3_9BILA|nr:unnamed protein product [Bursaphelenchus okinawaensis]CAG9112707.1 unnamed protein product [Bursaphelenchus okinawaensis]
MSLEGRVENFLRGLVGRSSTKPKATRSRSAHARTAGVVTYPELPLTHDSRRSARKKEEKPVGTEALLITEPNQPPSEEDTMNWMRRFRRSMRGNSVRKAAKSKEKKDKGRATSEENTVLNNESKGEDEPKEVKPKAKERKSKPPLQRQETQIIDPKLTLQRTKSVRKTEIVDEESITPPEPLVTHFPAIQNASEVDQYGGMSPQALWTSAKSQKNYQEESGYNSPLEVQVSPGRTVARSKSNPRSPRSPSSPPSRFSSPRSLNRTYSDPFRRSRFLAKSESNLRRLVAPDQSEEVVRYLRVQIQETKYVTAVFESAKGGLAPILGDLVKELNHWLGNRSRLLAVACEVHWSVPEKIRSRVVEIKMKNELHRALRQNNARVLRLYDENGGTIPLNLMDSKTEENCARDAGLDAFQGIYRRFYPALLNLQDYTTMDTHKSYWTLENLGSHRTPLQPAPTRFMYNPSRDILARKSVVALNMAVRLEVKSLLSGVPAAFRLLNVTVINVDDNQPEFTLTETERIISNETVQIRAWDDDLSPYNNIYYYLLPKCGSTRYVKIGEETGLLELDKDVPDGTKLCVYASSVQLVDDLDSLYYDKFNKAMVKLTVQKSDITLSSTWVLLDSDLKNQQIDLKLLDTGSELQYHVEDIQFYPMKGHAVSVNDLISIDEKTGILLLDPRIVDEPEGTYQVTVTIKGQTTYNQDIFVYYIRDYNKLRFVFDNNKDNVGLNLEAFRSQLQVILSSQRRKNVTIVDSEVCGAVEVNQRKRTHVCFFLTEHNKVLDSENGLDWLSTTLNANPRLIDLYSKFRVIDVDKCINLNSLLLHSSTTVLDREQLVWLSVILALVAVLVVLVAYSCLVKRVKDKRVVFEGTVVTRE